MPKPKNAAEKRNHLSIHYFVRQPILVALLEQWLKGGVLSMLDQNQINEVAELGAAAVMRSEKLTISLRRK